IPASIRKPGKYFEFNTKLAVRTLPGNLQRVLIFGQKLASGSQAERSPADLFSDEQAAQLFGVGSQLHLMARAAIKANPYLQLTAIAVNDPAGAAATGTTTLAGTASGSGVLTLWLGASRVDVAVNSGDTAAAVATALAAAVNAQPSIPVASAAAAGVVTHTCYHKGTIGNDIRLQASCSAPGLTATAAGM
ncbi:phage tail protein, partial [Chromobacterium violaceum]